MTGKYPTAPEAALAAAVLYSRITGNGARFGVLVRLHSPSELLASMTLLAQHLGERLYGAQLPALLAQLGDSDAEPPVMRGDPRAAMDLLAAHVAGDEEGKHAVLLRASAFDLATGFLDVGRALLFSRACADAADGVAMLRYMAQMDVTWEVFEEIDPTEQAGD